MNKKNMMQCAQMALCVGVIGILTPTFAYGCWWGTEEDKTRTVQVSPGSDYKMDNTPDGYSAAQQKVVWAAIVRAQSFRRRNVPCEKPMLPCALCKALTDETRLLKKITPFSALSEKYNKTEIPLHHACYGEFFLEHAEKRAHQLLKGLLQELVDTLPA